MARRTVSSITKQPNEVQAILAADRDPDVPVSRGARAREFRAAREHCASLGIDPDSVSDAVRQLSRKFKRGPLEILWQLADDETASRSARASAAMAILPYLQGKPKEVKESLKGQTSKVMEVPIAQSMEEWMSIAGPSQAALKARVRE